MKKTLHQFETMSVDELWLIHEEISQLLTQKIAEEKQQLERRLEQLNAGAGTAAGRSSNQREAAGGRRFYPKVYPKYRNLHNAKETWSGRGKQPKWVVRTLENGGKLDDLLIRNDTAEEGRPASLVRLARS